MAGYSGTPLPKKLGVKEGHCVALIGAPRDFDRTLGALPAEVDVRRDLRRRDLDVIVMFCPDVKTLRSKLDGAVSKLSAAGGLWIGWPKKSSGVETDLTESIVRRMGLDAGLVDNKICAIDDTWSGLRFVYRVKDRAKS